MAYLDTVSLNELHKLSTKTRYSLGLVVDRYLKTCEKLQILEDKGESDSPTYKDLNETLAMWKEEITHYENRIANLERKISEGRKENVES